MTEYITQDIDYPCTYDETTQPARAFQAHQENRPLLVILHSWSWGYSSCLMPSVEQWCADNEWNLICPHFRGPAWNSFSCGHEAALQDIQDAVHFAVQNFQADPHRVVLLGHSGGAMHALLLAARAPETWQAVAAWNPITDLRAWYNQDAIRNTDYQRNIEDACGGNPNACPAAEASAIARSPLTFLQPNLPCRIWLYAGLHDGQDGPVPPSQALNAFNALVLPEQAVSEQDVNAIAERQDVPEEIRFKGEEPAFQEHPLLCRKEADEATIAIYDGAHEPVESAIIQWLQDLQQEQQDEKTER